MVNNSTGVVYSMTSQDFIVAEPSDVTTYSMPTLSAGSNAPPLASADDSLQRAFSVDDAIVTGGTYVKTDLLTGSSLSPPAQIVVKLGSTGTDFDPNTTTINLLTLDGYDWDVILHEYGHYVASSYNFLATAGGTHNFGTHESLGLAWNEGWGTYFALAAERDQAAQPYVQSVPNVNGPTYDDTEDSNIHVNLLTQVGIGVTFAGKMNFGEDEELAVAASLYRLTQSGVVSDVTLFNDVRSASALTMGQAWDAIAGPLSDGDRANAGATLGAEGISPWGLISTVSATQPPTFTWDVTAPNGLNNFQLEFFDTSFVSQGTITVTGVTPVNPNATTASYSFTPSAAAWQNLLPTLSAGDSYTLQWVVEAQNTTPPATYANGNATTPGSIASSSIDRYYSGVQTISTLYPFNTITPADQSELLAGLQGFGQNVGPALDSDGAFNQPMPIDDQSAGQELALNNAWQNSVVTPLQQSGQTYNSPNDFVAGLNTLNQTDPVTVSNVTGGLQGNDLVFSLNLEITQTHTVNLDLGSGLSALGLGLDASAQVSVTTTLDMNFSFGLDLTPGLTAANAFFVNIHSMNVGVAISASNLNFGIHEGFLDAGVKNGAVELDAAIGVVFQNPNSSAGNGNITLMLLKEAGSTVS